MEKKTYRFRNLRKLKDFNKKRLTLYKICVTFLLCGPWADLWRFMGCTVNGFLYRESVVNAEGPFFTISQF